MCPFIVMAQNGRITVKAKLDSTLLLMGKQTALHLEIVQDKNAIGYFLNEKADTLSKNVEVINRPKADTIDLGNDRIEIKKTLIIQSFDSGMWAIPAMKYVVGKDTVTSNPLNLKVIPVLVDSLKSIHDIKGIVEPPFNLFDYLPSFITDYWWIYVIILVLAVIGAFVYIKWIKKGIIPLLPKKNEIPPYEEAIMQLQSLKEMKLWQAGQDKEYYTRLTDILRNYIDRRFMINAIEMTSSQIIDILKKNEETKAVNEQLKQILEIADIVKFAKVRPLPDDNEVAFIRAMTFVEDTKPEEMVKPEEKDEANAKSATEEEKINKLSNKK